MQAGLLPEGCVCDSVRLPSAKMEGRYTCSRQRLRGEVCGNLRIVGGSVVMVEIVDPRAAFAELATRYGFSIDGHSPASDRPYGEVIDYKHKFDRSIVTITWSSSGDVLHVGRSWGGPNEPGYEGSLGLETAREWIMQSGVEPKR